MFIEMGQVIAREGTTVWVQTQSKTGCSSCKVSSTCGSGIVNKAFSHKVFVTPLTNTIKADVNDEVEVGIPEDLVLKASLIVYLLPLLCLILAIAISSFFFPNMSELGSIMSAVIGLFVGFYGVRLLSKNPSRQRQLEPILIKIVKRPIAVTQIVTSPD